jgi:phage terminase small subunit
MRNKLTLVQARLSGAAAKNPQRYRAVPPEGKGELGEPPEHVGAAAAAVWRELDRVSPVGVLTESDRIPVEMLSNLVIEYRENPSGFQASRLAQMVSLLGRLGMTPIDRHRLAVVPDKLEKNEFDAF